MFLFLVKEEAMPSCKTGSLKETAFGWLIVAILADRIGLTGIGESCSR